MYIKEIVCADKEDSEADVIISDGVYTIKCYMYPVTDVLHSAESSGLRCVSERTLCKAQRTP